MREFSEGRYARCKGGWHWLSKIEENGMWGTLGSKGCIMAHVIAPKVRQGSTEFTLTVDEMRRRTGCTDSKKSRCVLGQGGVQELITAGLLEQSHGHDTYRVVMPDETRIHTGHLMSTGTSHVPSRTSHVPAGTSHVPNGTCHVPRNKEVKQEREKTRENTRGGVRDIADGLLDIYPAERRVSASTFALEFARAVQAWPGSSGPDDLAAAAEVGRVARLHLDAHRESGTEDRYFPAPRKFFEERIHAAPPAASGDDGESLEARTQELLRLVGGGS